ncbi:aldo/keto reductase [Sphingobium lignivorans]|uniref:Aryl-alcohol dehydrogenase-like predicted oxidoreductase n=1 Tax=Sphingobium lignivorans TaxID=2735886 RepID=A0ABR6NJ63_9SPHN|nr:aldo/keto reductase [Sphingobium lignivorans]MBB5987314.1 aryl-alcohol dehydrogenase-like predicted oxidoreductase [Sphingobium lignivorans]
MRYNQLGRTGLTVSELCLGTMTFGSGEGLWTQIGQLGQSAADAMVKTAFDAGINFYDTANVYSSGSSEAVLGQAIRNLGLARTDVVIATKVLGPMGSGVNDRGLSRGHIMDQVKASLKRLQTDHIDLYQVHGLDNATPIEETVRALDDLVRQGHVRYVGVSNWAAWQIAKAHGLALAQNLARFESLQAYYSIAGRDLERELVPMLLSERVGLMVWSPLAGGLLSGKFSRDGAGEGRRASFDFPLVDKDKAFDIIDVMRPMAQSRSVSVAQIALAWLLHQRVVTSVIVGATRLDQLADNIAASDVELTEPELAALAEASRLAPEYPGWMLARQGEYREVAGAAPPRWRR